MAVKSRCTSSSPPQNDQWFKGKLIGSGSFGNVNLAIDSVTGALFAAKSAKSEAGISSLEHEADILSNLDSPYIVKFIGKDVPVSKTGNGADYNVFFEYMAGGSLSDVVQNFGGMLDERLIRLYTRGILRGLEYLHGNGIVHCDIKCKNVLVAASGAVKLADFGCATRLTSDASKMPSSLSKPRDAGTGGTPLWMAPEVLRNETIDFSADIWSVGCAVVEMATGRPPWGGDEANPTAAMIKIAKGNNVPDFPRNFSPEGLDFLSKCLERDPRSRWTCRKLLDHPFLAEKKITNALDDARSPTSVLNGPDYDDDGEEEDEFLKRIEAVRGRCVMEMKGVVKCGEIATEFDDKCNEGWVTVRSHT
ncbi:mitogen-activated protein kinase kinase kinase 18-like [Andrographis paniculata]|uniref:mitogen-activated protein kinase kinase kinase 18-like n=1 Tax=Andrographis paniculata TaxID=175694 RepID=UPI0021E86D69|nr:mitogen-activated protein kinase kinase kinase 18-like [Andrographis paniculata]